MLVKILGAILTCTIMWQMVKATTAPKEPNMPKKMTDADVLAVTAGWGLMCVGIIMMTL